MIQNHHFSLISVCELPGYNVVPWVRKIFLKVNYTRVSKDNCRMSQKMFSCGFKLTDLIHSIFSLPHFYLNLYHIFNTISILKLEIKIIFVVEKQ